MADNLLFSTMLVEKSEDIIGPDSRSKVTERMAIVRSIPTAGINLQFVGFVRILHRPQIETCSATGQNHSPLAKRKLAQVHFEPKQSLTLAAPAPPPSFGRLRLNRRLHNSFHVPHPRPPPMPPNEVPATAIRLA